LVNAGNRSLVAALAWKCYNPRWRSIWPRKLYNMYISAHRWTIGLHIEMLHFQYTYSRVLRPYWPPS